MSTATDLNDAEQMEDTPHHSSLAVPTSDLNVAKNQTHVPAESVHDGRDAADGREVAGEEQGNDERRGRNDYAMGAKNDCAD